MIFRILQQKLTFIRSARYQSSTSFCQNLTMELCLTSFSYFALGMLMLNSASIPLRLFMPSKNQPRHWDNSFGSGSSELVPVSILVSFQKKKALVTGVKQQQLESQLGLEDQEWIVVETTDNAQLEEVKAAKRQTQEQPLERSHKHITARCSDFLTCVPIRSTHSVIMSPLLQGSDPQMAIRHKLYVFTRLLIPYQFNY